MSTGPRRAATTPDIPLTPAESHLLSVLDGELADDELALICGVSPAQVRETIERLALLGAVTFGPEPDADEPPGEPEIALPAAALPLIDALFDNLKSTDYFTLLGVGTEADKNDVKRAYYRLAPAFHPDKHYGKHLGPYKARIEAVFTHLTRAHDTLRYSQRRAAYEAELGGGNRVRLSPAGFSAHVAADAILGRPSEEDELRNSTVPVPSSKPNSGVPASDAPTGVYHRAPRDSNASSRHSTAPPPPRSSRPLATASPSQPSASTPGAAARRRSSDRNDVNVGGRTPRRRPSAANRETVQRHDSSNRVGVVRKSLSGQIQRPSRPNQRRLSPAMPFNAIHDQRRRSSTAVPRESRPAQPGSPQAGSAQPAVARSEPAQPTPVPNRRSHPRVAAVRAESAPDPAPNPNGHPAAAGHGGGPAARRAGPAQARRNALRRKLGGRDRVAQPPATYDAYPAPPKDVPRSAAEVLRDNFDEAARHVKRRRFQRYVAVGKGALEAGDFRAAAAAFAQALKLDPTDSEAIQLADHTTTLLKR